MSIDDATQPEGGPAGQPGDSPFGYGAPGGNPYASPAYPPAYGQAGYAVPRPGKVQAIAIMTLVGGILATIYSLVWLTCLWPPSIYGIVMGIMAIVKGAALLGSNAQYEAPPKTIAIMQIVNIINLDIANVVMGIITLVFLSDPEVDGWYQGR